MLDEIKQSVQEKWLTYYETNVTWLKGSNCYLKTRSGELLRPNPIAVLAAITALEPRLSTLMPDFLELSNNDMDRIIKMLGLDFDPDEELEEDEESDENNDQNSENVDVSEN